MPLSNRVSLHPEGGSCHIHVEGSQNAKRVRRTLVAAGIDANGPVHREGTGTYVLFVQYSSQITHSRLQQVLRGTPGFTFYG